MSLSSVSHVRRARATASWRIAGLALLLLVGPELPAVAQDPADRRLPAAQAAVFAAQAETWRRQLAERVMPYWYDITLDREDGGYRLPQGDVAERPLVSQARLIWGFSHAWRHGIRDPQRDYLAAAEHGYQFLMSRLHDPQHGGFYWLFSRGRVVDERKLLDGQAFVIAALVEYYRASGDAAALRQAADLFRTVAVKARDAEHGGWHEHFERDWRPILDPEANLPVGMAGMKSGNALLHWIEALTALHLVSREGGGEILGETEVGVEAALAEALDRALQDFFPEAPGRAYPYRQADWQRPLGPRFKEISYGHNLEFAWRMLDAQAALGRAPLWSRFDALLDHALEHGFDHERGGAYALGFGDRPALVTEKIWWVQAEMLAALTTGIRHSPAPERVDALAQLLQFLTAHQIDPRDGMWFDAVKADGSPWRPAKAHRGKVNDHDRRAMVRFIETFGNGAPAAGG